MTKANEVSRVDLLQRDVEIQFFEIRRLRAENDELKLELEYYKANAPDAKKEIAYYIQAQRTARKLSADKFARLLDTNATTIRNYERAEGRLDLMQSLVRKIQKLGRG